VATTTAEVTRAEWVMSDEQFEAAARRVCRLMGVDPDGAVTAPSPQRNGVMLAVVVTESQWKSVERQLRWQFAQMSVLLPYLHNET